jgi:hypothetical protein
MSHMMANDGCFRPLSISDTQDWLEPIRLAMASWVRNLKIRCRRSLSRSGVTVSTAGMLGTIHSDERVRQQEKRVSCFRRSPGAFNVTGVTRGALKSFRRMACVLLLHQRYSVDTGRGRLHA